MGVLSLCWRSSRRQALRTLRKGLDMLRRRKHGTTDLLALPHQHRRYGEIAETVRSAPGRDPRMARFIRNLGAMARETAQLKVTPGIGNLGGLTRPPARCLSAQLWRFPAVFRGIDDGSIHLSR